MRQCFVARACQRSIGQTAIELAVSFTYHAPALAGVAQLVEQRIRNAKVGGSTPLSGTIPLFEEAQSRAGLFCFADSGNKKKGRQQPNPV